MLMPLIDKIRSELQRLFERQGEHGIVVWYDAHGTLSELVANALPKGVRLLQFEGSYLALRFELEEQSPDLTGKWLIYVPESAPKQEESWLRDYELLGERLEMDLLELLHRQYGLALTHNLIELLRNHPENSRDLANKWEQVMGGKVVSESEILNALLALAFGLPHWDLRDAILKFLCESGLQGHLSERGLWRIWRETLRDWFGWSESETPDNEDALRQRIRAAVLLAELVNADPSYATRFPFVPSEVQKRQVTSELAKRWRDSMERRESYQQAANEVEQQYNLRGVISLNEGYLGLETFRAIDEAWIQELRSAVSPDGSNFAEKVEKLEQIAEKRKGLFWARIDERMVNFWDAVFLAAKLWRECEGAIKASERLQQVDEFVTHYTDEKGWWQLDFWALQLAAKQTSLSEEDKKRFVAPAWSKYRQFLDSVNRRFVESAKREGWSPTQLTFWQSVRSAPEKIAIFIVDALRFDLAKYLRECVGSDVNFEICLLKAMLPSITEIGMAALLPNADEGLSVAWEGDRLTVRLRGEEVGSRNGRMNWLRQKVGTNGKVVELDELQRTKIEEALVLVVFSRQIDEFGTFAADLLPQGLLDIANRVAQAINFVAEKGYHRIFVVADHGFLFASRECEPNYVPAPSSAQVKKRRFIVGGQTEGCWVVRANEIGLQGDLLFTFPEGFSVVSLPGEVESFLHGGLSLQESIVPMLCGKVTAPIVKVTVKMQVQEPISSRIVRVIVEADVVNLFAKPRKVKVRVGERESEVVELSGQRQREELSFVWLNEFVEPPEAVNVQLIDVETNEVLEEKSIQVKLII